MHEHGRVSLGMDQMINGQNIHAEESHRQHGDVHRPLYFGGGVMPGIGKGKFDGKPLGKPEGNGNGMALVVAVGWGC